nr:multiple epidermal growth factor-like domains protein 10 [Crassostrea gigas]
MLPCKWGVYGWMSGRFFVGTHCNKSCNEGYFGTNCSRGCSPNCQPDICRPTDGLCSCAPGWTGANCTTICNNGYFGTYCLRKCSPYCELGTCRHTDGGCSCDAGWMEDYCTKEKLPKNRNMSSSNILVIGLSISLLINLIFLVCGSLLCRGIATNRVTFNGSILSCWKKSVYQNAVVKSDETSTYQELYISENAYQNTTIR